MRRAIAVLCILSVTSTAFAADGVDYEPFGGGSSAAAGDGGSNTPAPMTDGTAGDAAAPVTPTPTAEIPPSPPPTATSNPDPLAELESQVDDGERDPASLTKLQVSLAELAYEKDKNAENLGALVLAREKLVQQVCMPRLLTTLQHAGYDPENQECVDALEQVFKLDSASPAAFCARDGIDSENCHTAASRQTVGPYGPLFDPSRDLDPSSGSGPPSTRDAVRSVSRELADAKKRVASSKGFEQARLRDAVKGLYHRLLVLNCAVVRLELTHSSNSRPIVSRSRPSASSSLEDAIAALEVKPAATPPRSIFNGQDPLQESKAPQKESYGPAYARKRLLPNACLYYVNDALRFDPRLPTAICHRDGFSAPSCISALREATLLAQKQEAEWRAAAQATAAARGVPTRPPRNSGFSTF